MGCDLMKQRIITGTIMVLIIAPLMIVQALKPVYDVMMVVLGIGAMYELIHMFDKDKKIPIVTRIFAVFLMLVLYASFVNYIPQCSDTVVVKFLKLVPVNINSNKHLSDISPLFAIFLVFIVFMSSLVLVRDFTVADLGRLYIAMIYVSVAVAAMTALRQFGVRFIVYLALITSLTDVFALVFGMLLGKHKMAPTISPKKTWEGAIGGTVTATIVGTLVIIFYPYFSHIFHDGANVEFFDQVFAYNDFTTFGKVSFVIILTIFLSACGQTGDLVASKFKRDFKVKDYSNIFPGHGGILDRFDSIMFASAVFYAFIIMEIQLFPLP